MQTSRRSQTIGIFPSTFLLMFMKIFLIIFVAFYSKETEIVRRKMKTFFYIVSLLICLLDACSFIHLNLTHSTFFVWLYNILLYRFEVSGPKNKKLPLPSHLNIETRELSCPLSHDQMCLRKQMKIYSSGKFPTFWQI